MLPWARCNHKRDSGRSVLSAATLRGQRIYGYGFATESAVGASYEANVVRKLIQFVLIVALLFGGDLLSAAAMPCCAPTASAAMQASMQMRSAMPTEASCHDRTMTKIAADTSSMQVAAMLRCPRAAAATLASNEWKNGEQTERHSPLQIVRNVSADSQAFMADTSRVSQFSRLSIPLQTDLSNTLPLRI